MLTSHYNNTISNSSTITSNSNVTSSIEIDLQKVLFHRSSPLTATTPTTHHHQYDASVNSNSTISSSINNNNQIRELKKVFQKWWDGITDMVVQQCNTILSQLSSAAEVTTTVSSIR